MHVTTLLHRRRQRHIPELKCPGKNKLRNRNELVETSLQH